MKRSTKPKNMTIKKRLVISNILMIIIPMIISLVIVLGSLQLTWMWIVNALNKDPLYNYSDEKILGALGETLASEQDSTELVKLLEEYTMDVVVYDETGKQYAYGTETIQYRDLLLENILEIGGEGYIYINDSYVYGQKYEYEGKSYTVYMIYNIIYDGVVGNYDKMINIRLIVVVIIAIISIVISVGLTNRFLTHFVFRKINQSLDLLADGVRQIRDGNLEHRIIYNGGDEFTPVCEDFNDMALRLQASVELTQKQERNHKELIAGISHDLRSPLTSIKAYVEGLLDGVAKTTQSQREYMLIIKNKSEDIDHMVSRLFLFSKMDMGEYPNYPEYLNLSQEIMSYVQATKMEYLEKGLSIKMEPLASEIMVNVDPIQLRRILSNILENSLKYKDKIDASAEIYLKNEGETVSIVVEDNGPGVPVEALDKLFDVFYRNDASRSNPNAGSGLGLAITAKAVKYMGGTIYAQNRVPSGLRIIIELPIAEKE